MNNAMSEPNGFASQLATKISHCGIQLTQAQQDKLVAFLNMLKQWNASFNLTAIHEHRWVNELLLDALVAIPYIKTGPVLDVGSGAGVPAIPLAIALPEVQFTLLDSNGKKTRFINQVVINLQIPNVDVVQSRVEEFTPPAGFAQITSRAFAALDQFVSMTAHLLAAEGEWLAWKGDNIGAELNKLGADIQHLESIPVTLPDTATQRYIVRLKKDGQSHLG
jgi:16S rRNA (guanine527-N7)-methyltransferase